MSKPIELYKFTEASETFTQVRNGHVAVIYNTETYMPYAINRGPIETKTELVRANLDITMNRTNPVAMRYLANPIDFVVTLSIFWQANGSTNTRWRGRLVSVDASGEKIKMRFESIFTSLGRYGCRARFTRPCRHVLYGRGCNPNDENDPEDFKIAGTVTAIDKLELTVTGISGETINRFKGGMIRAPNTVVRFVTSSTATTITLSRRFETLEALIGAGPIDVDFFPGCDHTHGAMGCGYFNNHPNYGGFLHIPKKNPMGGSRVM